MILTIRTIGLTLAAATLAIGIGAGSADAQQPRDSVLSRNRGPSPDYSYQQGPRTRIYVTKRHWLDLGTEVQPGERKYTDYAIPPGYTQSTIDQLTGRPWTRQPLVDPWDLPGYAKGGYGY
jgi:hypothetical protein